MIRQFDLMLTGKILPGHQREAVAAALARVLELSETQVQSLLSGREWLVRQSLDSAELENLQTALSSAGVETRVREVAPQALPVSITFMDCPCCGHNTLPRRGAGDQCHHCGWRDDHKQNELDPDKVLPGINRGLSLRQARAEYAVYGTLDPGRYRANAYPLRKRVINGLVALLVIAYCGWSLWRGEMFLWASNRSASLNVHSSNLLGSEVWLMSAGMLAAVSVGLLMIADHYDRRRNEHRYRSAGQACYVLMVVFIGLAMTLHAYRTDGPGFAVVIGVLMSVFVTMVIVHRKGYRL